MCKNVCLQLHTHIYIICIYITIQELCCKINKIGKLIHLNTRTCACLLVIV